MKGVICVGANLGQEVEGWISQGVEDMILFEPVLATFQKLQKIVSNKPAKIQLYNLALGNMSGFVSMFVEESHQGKSSSILKPLLHLEQYPDIEFTNNEIVKIDKLDNINYDRFTYDFLHVDTQGYELEVLKGAEQSLEFINTIVCEVYRRELYKDCPMIEDIISFLAERGFEVKDIVFWRGISWGDATFKRR